MYDALALAFVYVHLEGLFCNTSASLAQLGERRTFNPVVAGSSPVRGTGDFRNIYKKMCKSEECTTILGQMQAFLQSLPTEETFRNSVTHPNLSKLITVDQLLRFRNKLRKDSSSTHHYFNEFKEQPIQFWCTYKRDTSGQFRLWKITHNSISGRVPGYADRILAYNMDGTNYKVERCLGSDHAPVSMTITRHYNGKKVPNVQQIKIISFNTASTRPAVLNVLDLIKTEKEAARNKVVFILCVQEIDSSLHNLLTTHKGANDKALLYGEISTPLFKWHGFRLGIYCTLPQIIRDTNTESFEMFHQWSPRAHTKGFMWVDVQIKNCKFLLINAHCPPFGKETEESWKKLDAFTQDKINNGQEAIVICGDLNSRSAI